MRSVADYQALVPPLNSDKPKFQSTVAASVAPLVNAGQTVEALPAAFDIDVALGAQLDVVGQWVGQSRRIPTPIAGLYFSFDAPLLGFDKGVWKGPYDTGAGISLLDDETYRRLLKTRILANAWDGTAGGAQDILDTYFINPATHVFVEDDGQTILNENYFSFDDPLRGFDLGQWSNSTTLANAPSVDMAMTVGVSGSLPSILDLAILGLGLIPIKPIGVDLTYAVTSVDGASLFGFDVENEFIAGFDTAAWGVDPSVIPSLAV